MCRVKRPREPEPRTPQYMTNPFDGAGRGAAGFFANRTGRDALLIRRDRGVGAQFRDMGHRAAGAGLMIGRP